MSKRQELLDRHDELTVRIMATREAYNRELTFGRRRAVGVPTARESELDAKVSSLRQEQLDIEEEIKGLTTLDGLLKQRAEHVSAAESYAVLIEGAHGPERRQLREKLHAILADIGQLDEKIDPLTEAERRAAAAWRRHIGQGGPRR